MTRWQNGIHLDSGEKITFGDSTEQSTASYHTGGRKNYVINPNFDMWQYATSQASGDSGFGSADRWYCHESVACTRTISRQTFTTGQADVPNNPLYYMRVNITDSGSGSGDIITINNRIEDVHTLAGEDVTLSFYAKADSSLYLSSELGQYFGSGTGGSGNVMGIGTQKHTLTTSWQQFTKPISIPSISGKSLNSGGLFTSYLKVRFFLSAGSDWNTETDSLGFQTGTFDIAQVQLEKGGVATDFEYEPFHNVLRSCERYCYKWNSNRAARLPGLATSTTSCLTSMPAAIEYMRDYPNSITQSGSIIARHGVSGSTVVSYASESGGFMILNKVSGSDFTAGNPVLLYPSGSGYLLYESEMPTY